MDCRLLLRDWTRLESRLGRLGSLLGLHSDNLALASLNDLNRHLDLSRLLGGLTIDLHCQISERLLALGDGCPDLLLLVLLLILILVLLRSSTEPSRLLRGFGCGLLDLDLVLSLGEGEENLADTRGDRELDNPASGQRGKLLDNGVELVADDNSDGSGEGGRGEDSRLGLGPVNEGEVVGRKEGLGLEGGSASDDLVGVKTGGDGGDILVEEVVELVGQGGETGSATDKDNLDG